MIDMVKFAVVWQESVSRAAVCKALGLSDAAVRSRYYVCKRNGVPLKSFGPKPRTDWVAVKSAVKAAWRK